MMLKRRIARATLFSACRPPSSGPRCTRTPLIRAATAGFTDRSKSTIPQIPHMEPVKPPESEPRTCKSVGARASATDSLVALVEGPVAKFGRAAQQLVTVRQLLRLQFDLKRAVVAEGYGRQTLGEEVDDRKLIPGGGEPKLSLVRRVALFATDQVVIPVPGERDRDRRSPDFLVIERDARPVGHGIDCELAL